MTSERSDPFYGPPPPITKLTMEQDLKMRVLRDKLEEGYHDKKEDIITLLVAIQHQNFIMGNSIENLIKNWPYEEIFLIHSSERVPI